MVTPKPTPVSPIFARLNHPNLNCAKMKKMELTLLIQKFCKVYEVKIKN